MIYYLNIIYLNNIDNIEKNWNEYRNNILKVFMPN